MKQAIIWIFSTFISMGGFAQIKDTLGPWVIHQKDTDSVAGWNAVTPFMQCTLTNIDSIERGLIILDSLAYLDSDENRLVVESNLWDSMSTVCKGRADSASDSSIKTKHLLEAVKYEKIAIQLVMGAIKERKREEELINEVCRLFSLKGDLLDKLYLPKNQYLWTPPKYQ